VDHGSNITPPTPPKDARKATEEQRDLQEKLDHQDDDPDAPGLHQSRHDLPDESTREIGTVRPPAFSRSVGSR